MSLWRARLTKFETMCFLIGAIIGVLVGITVANLAGCDGGCMPMVNNTIEACKKSCSPSGVMRVTSTACECFRPMEPASPPRSSP